MSATEVPIPKVMSKITLRLNSAIRDAVEHLEEGHTHSDLEISVHGNLRYYEDGHKVFSWKGKDAIVFYPMKIEVDENGNPQIDFSFEKLYDEID